MIHSLAMAAARELALQIRAHGFQAYLVGGCVRDGLLGIEPKDYDICTDARPDQIAALFPDAALVGASFGVVLVPAGGFHVEVSTFRSDGLYIDGRRPESVSFESSPEADVLRRDFTINGLLLDPATGEVIDYAGGRDDLRNGIVRAIGDPAARFREDHLRMLRAVRFAARFAFRIEPETFRAIQLLHSAIGRISAERIRGELNRILTEGGARRGFELLDESLLLPDILPEVAALKGVAQPPEFHPEGDVWTHTLLLLQNLRAPSVELAWGALLHDIGKPATFRLAERIRFDGHVEAGVEIARRILTRLRFSHDSIRRVEALVANHMRFMHVHRMRRSTLKRFLSLEHFDEHMELHRLDCLASRGDLSSYEFAASQLKSIPPAERKPPRLLSGGDLIGAGFLPGPVFAAMIAAAEDAQLEGRIHTREEALTLVKNRFPEAPRTAGGPVT